MLNILEYLHYRKTKDGNPRVVAILKDYHSSNSTDLLKVELSPKSEWDAYRKDGTIIPGGKTVLVAKLEDCRPLLNTNYYGTPLRELAVFEWGEGKCVMLFYFNGITWQVKTQYIDTSIEVSEYFIKRTLTSPDKFLGYFESDPAKYSKLLWNCSEKKGWDMILELLKINL